MVLILSSDLSERTTEEVIDWLYSWGCPYISFNGELLTSLSYCVDIKNSIFAEFYGENIKEDINVVWFRRWHRQVDIESIELNSMDSLGFVNLKKFLTRELNTFSSFLFWQLNDAIWIDSPLSVIATAKWK